MSPTFPTLDEVLEMHQDQIERYGGSSRVRDLGLLESALSQPLASFDGKYLHPDLFAMAAAYLFHVVKNHPFVDGNKRVGLVVALVFLTINNCEIEAPDDEIEQLVLGVAQGNVNKELIAGFLRSHVL